MNTTLTIPSPIATKVPKPSKAHLIEALVERERLRIETHNNRLKEVVKILRDKADAIILAEARKINRNQWKPIHQGRYGQAGLFVEIEVISPEASQLVLQANRTPWLHFDKAGVKREITERLKAPNPLLEDTTMNPSLDKLLESIYGRRPAIEA